MQDCAAAEDIMLVLDGQSFRGRYHAAPAGTPAVLWVFGSGGGLGGPAGGIYERLGERLCPAAASLQVDYRKPCVMSSCVSDILEGLAFLKTRGHTRVVLVGHSFGGAVVVNAALASSDVIAVASLSPQNSGVGDIAKVSPRPMLFVHGEADEVLPTECAVTLYHNAGEPRKLILYPDALHGLDQCKDQLDRDLMAWLQSVLAAEVPVPSPS